MNMVFIKGHKTNVGRIKYNIKEEVLRQLYKDGDLNGTEIATIYGCDRKLIYLYLKKFGFPLKSLGETHKGGKVWNKGKKGLQGPNSGSFKKGEHEMENNPSWKGGISFEPYGKEFTNKLKEKIRLRDKFKCQECNIHQDKLDYKLHIHHIDYDKKNSSEENLISLCRSCHSQTNFSRDNWTEYFKNKISDLKR